MNEKEAIERATAEGFLRLYNELMKETYCITEHKDAPDICCRNKDNETLNLEITITEDMPMDIASLLGRSNHRSVEALQRNIKDVKAGRASPQFSSLSGNVERQVTRRRASAPGS
jgi:hypothetical protein